MSVTDPVYSSCPLKEDTAMEQASFAGRFRVGSRIYFGFAVVLLLLGILAWVGVSGMNSAERSC